MSLGSLETTDRADGRQPLRVVTGDAVDIDAAVRAVFDLLVAVGQDPRSTELIETPRRVATALIASLTSEPLAMTTFPNDSDYDEMVVVREIAFQSLCNCHMLPFGGVAHVAYVPGHRIVGLSKVARLVEHFSRSLQTQERLTVEVADALEATLAPRGVGVVLQATHLCAGPRAGDGRTHGHVTTAMRGQLRDDLSARDEFIRQCSGPGRGSRRNESR